MLVCGFHIRSPWLKPTGMNSMHIWKLYKESILQVISWTLKNVQNRRIPWFIFLSCIDWSGLVYPFPSRVINKWQWNVWLSCFKYLHLQNQPGHWEGKARRDLVLQVLLMGTLRDLKSFSMRGSPFNEHGLSPQTLWKPGTLSQHGWNRGPALSSANIPGLTVCPNWPG